MRIIKKDHPIPPIFNELTKHTPKQTQIIDSKAATAAAQASSLYYNDTNQSEFAIYNADKHSLYFSYGSSAAFITALLPQLIVSEKTLTIDSPIQVGEGSKATHIATLLCEHPQATNISDSAITIEKYPGIDPERYLEPLRLFALDVLNDTKFSQGASLLTRPGYNFYFAKLGAEIVGVIGLTRSAVDVRCISYFYIKPDFRGRGYGALLLNHLLVQTEQGRGFFLNVNTENIAAVALYQRFNFIDIGQRVRYQIG